MLKFSLFSVLANEICPNWHNSLLCTISNWHQWVKFSGLQHDFTSALAYGKLSTTKLENKTNIHKNDFSAFNWLCDTKDFNSLERVISYFVYSCPMLLSLRKIQIRIKEHQKSQDSLFSLLRILTFQFHWMNKS